MLLENQPDLRRWEFVGPVAKAYELCRAPLAMIQGPVGGGKTTASSRRYLRVATWQEPSPRDRVRKARILCICPTYRRAWDTIMPSYFKVFPQTMGEFRGSRGDPADHIFDLQVRVAGEPSTLHIETLFRAVNDLDIEDFLRGFEVTAIHLPEADTNTDLGQLLSLGGSRVGRYPEPEDRPEVSEAYSGIFGDANAPVIGTAFYDRMHLKRMPDGTAAPLSDRLFLQPSGFSPNAENIKNLRKIRADFYEHMQTQLDQYDVGRMIKNRPGFGRHGMPVHPNFDQERHVAKQALEVDRYSPVYIGVDAGSNTLKPAATFSQRTYSGQWRKLREIYLPDGIQMNTADFGYAIRRVMDADLRHAPGAMLCLDPAAGGRNASSEFTTAQELQGSTGIEAQLAPSNQPKHRRSATDRLLKASAGPGEPAVIIDPSMIGTIQGYVGGFHYKRRGQVVALSPEKNSFSHVIEADEYAHLCIEGIGPSEGRFIRPDGEGSNDAPRGIYAD